MDRPPKTATWPSDAGENGEFSPATLPAQPTAVALAPRRQVSAATWEATRRRFYTAMLVPGVVMLTLITIAPILYLIGTSFTPWDLSRPGSLEFIGFRNYIRLLTEDTRFWNSVWVQVKLSSLTVPLQVVIGLGLALYLYLQQQIQRLVEIFRNVFIIPMVIPPVVAALMWRILFTPEVSILNYAFGVLGLPQVRWLGHPTLALLAIALADVWQFFPFCMLLLYAGLQALPGEPTEAARIDGASTWQLIRHVLVPMLYPTLAVVILFRVVDSIRTFPLIYVITQGGPGFATEPTNYYAYQQGLFHGYVGYSSAMVVIMFFFTLALSVVILRTTRREEAEA
ncbi:MAG: carbohydrate ABC transporter permease [Anaerolineae bacterium]|mgnify:CR=1 FL=1